MIRSVAFKMAFIAGLSLVFFGCTTAKPPGIEGKIVNCGVYIFPDKAVIIKTPETASGVTYIPAGKPVLMTATNRIPAWLGIRFGMTYYVKNLPVANGYVDITKIAKHPLMTKPDGTTSTGFTTVEKQFVKDGQLVGWTGYGFDHDYELAPGRWEFTVMFEGQPLCKQDFTVFKE